MLQHGGRKTNKSQNSIINVLISLKIWNIWKSQRVFLKNIPRTLIITFSALLFSYFFI